MEQPEFELRHPDYSVELRSGEESEQNSCTSRDPYVAERVHYVRRKDASGTNDGASPYTSKLLLLGEVVSKSTRSIDLNQKWNTYAKSGVPLYLIHDRTIGKNKPRLIIGSLDPITGSVLSTSGGKQTDPLTDGSIQTCYYRKVYEKDEIINLRPFDHIHVTAGNFMDRKYMTELADRLDRQRRHKAEVQLPKERRRADKEQKQKERLKQILEGLGESVPSTPESEDSESPKTASSASVSPTRSPPRKRGKRQA